MNKIYLKLFLASGIPFGIFQGFVNTLQDGLPVGLGVGFISGILFGGFFSLILGLSHSFSVKRLPFGISDEAMGVHHLRSVKLTLPYDVVFNLCIKSLDSIEHCQIKKKNRSKGIISAKTGISWKSAGDIISFKILRIDDEITKVEVYTRPFIRTTLVDYGKNLESIETIIRIIKENRDVIV